MAVNFDGDGLTDDPMDGSGQSANGSQGYVASNQIYNCHETLTRLPRFHSTDLHGSSSSTGPSHFQTTMSDVFMPSLPEQSTVPQSQVKRRPGRPKGSKSKKSTSSPKSTQVKRPVGRPKGSKSSKSSGGSLGSKKRDPQPLFTGPLVRILFIYTDLLFIYLPFD
jgi:hypothetical protein